jgi:hypothetical protein
MSRFAQENPEIGPRPKYYLVAVLGHAAGGFGAETVRVTGETRKQLLDASWASCIGSRYVSRLYDPKTSETVWTEHEMWKEDQDQAV